MGSVGEVCGDVSANQPLQNGHIAPKYKVRKVSAVRDFPPRCGPNFVPVNVKTEESGEKVVEVVDLVGDEEDEGVKASEMRQVDEIGGTKDSEVGNGVYSSGIRGFEVEDECRAHEEVNSDMDIDAFESLDNLVEKVSASVYDIEDIMIGVEPLKVELHDDFNGHTHVPIEIPIQVESAEDLDTLLEVAIKEDGFSNDVAEKITGTAPVGVDLLNNVKSNPSKSLGQMMSKEINEVEVSLVQNPGIEEARFLFDAGASGVEVPLPGHSVSSSSFCDSIPDISITLKDKYRRRRVSAVRDFPPNCGTNIASAPKEKNHTSEVFDVEQQRTVPRNSSGATPAVSNKECQNEIDEVHDHKKTTDTFNDGAGGQPLVKKVAEDARTIRLQELTEVPVEVGLMDFEERRTGLTDSNIEKKTETIRSVKGSGSLPKPLADNSTEDAGELVGKKSVDNSLDNDDRVRAQHRDSSSGNELHREVVHGLMAAPNCPWGKVNIALNKSDGGKRAGNIKQKRKQKSEAAALNSNLKVESSEGFSKKRSVTPDSYNADRSPGTATSMESGDRGAFDEYLTEVTPISMFKPLVDNSDEDSAEAVGKEIVLYSPGGNDPVKPSPCVFSSANDVGKEIVVHASNKSNKGRIGETSWQQSISSRKKFKAVAKKSAPKAEFSSGPSKQRNKVPVSNYEDGDEEGNGRDRDLPSVSRMYRKRQGFDVRLPPFGPNSSSHGDARNRVRETLRLFHTICRKLLQKEESNSKPEEDGTPKLTGKRNRIDLLTAKIIKEKGKEVNTDKQILGQVPGVEVGDEFQYRVELAVVGIHRLYQAGIDWMKLNGVQVACSVVASGGYTDDMDDADVLKYSGQGGNLVGKAGKKQPEDQKLERGNLALSNSKEAGNPIRVVRGWKETKVVDHLDSRPKTVTTYVYDGLYKVKDYWTEMGPHGKLVFMFELRRIPGQPELAWKELRKSSKSKSRPGVCVPDISGGQEPFPICAVNTIDDDKPPPFKYTSKMLYPDWYHPITPAGCDCVGRCIDSKKCKCAVRNGGEIPYNRNGSIVEVKPLVYECGPHCKCPPSCYNRVTQRGLKFKLEIFKTESRGWGIRSFTSIPSGSFICEYAGELLEDKEAEKRVGNDEYLFDIGQNYSDSSINPDEQAMSVEIMEDGGYTIDAAQFGNIGRFVNHSCSPNLYAQNVIYDHDDKRMPHVMLFAAENIPPLQELTYHYNYALDQVRDSDGNIKIKKCYCGSAECTGRMY